jgi:hypothetical protein
VAIIRAHGYSVASLIASVVVPYLKPLSAVNDSIVKRLLDLYSVMHVFPFVWSYILVASAGVVAYVHGVSVRLGGMLGGWACAVFLLARRAFCPQSI